jgi:hypothetical protein
MTLDPVSGGRDPLHVTACPIVTPETVARAQAAATAAAATPTPAEGALS